MIERHFATVDTQWGPKQIHYRRCGSGPAALLLHQSPQSSGEYEDLMREWSDRFTVIAPDYPGFGLSDPFGDDGELELGLDDFAAVLIAFLDEIGVAAAPAYGFHTGAGMAVAMADHSPAHITAVYANGYVIMTGEEIAAILRGYLPPFAKHWDGSHLLWLWTRNRDQLIFFPWFDRRAEARLRRTVPPPEVLQDWAMELLRADDHYRVGYRAAFRYPGDVPLRTLEVPAIITATATDVLGAFLPRITAPSPTVQHRVGGTMQDNLDEAAAYFQQHPGSAVPPAPATRPVAGRPWCTTVAFAHGYLRVRCCLEGSGMPVLLVHELGGACETVAATLEALAGQRPVIALDLPGHGESAGAPTGMPYLETCRAALTAVLDHFRIARACGLGTGEGATVLADYARHATDRLQALYLADAPDLTAAQAAELAANFAPDITPVWHGGHLLEWWHVARNRMLFLPWYEQTDAAALAGEPRADADDLHARTVALMKSAAVLAHAAADIYSYPLDGVCKQLTLPVARGAAPLPATVLDFFAGVSDD